MTWNQPIAHSTLQKQHKCIAPRDTEWCEQIERSWNQCVRLEPMTGLQTLLDNRTPDMQAVKNSWTRLTEVFHQIGSAAAASLEPPANHDFSTTFTQCQQAAAAAA